MSLLMATIPFALMSLFYHVGTNISIGMSNEEILKKAGLSSENLELHKR